MNEDALHGIDDYKECQRLRRVINEEQKLHKETVRLLEAEIDETARALLEAQCECQSLERECRAAKDALTMLTARFDRVKEQLETSREAKEVYVTMYGEEKAENKLLCSLLKLKL